MNDKDTMTNDLSNEIKIVKILWPAKRNEAEKINNLARIILAILKRKTKTPGAISKI